MADLVTTKDQYVFDLKVEKEVEIDGVGMGVLSDGTAYLTARGLARMCGIDHTLILRLTEHWNDGGSQPRTRKIRELLRQQGLDLNKPYISITINSTQKHVYSEIVCMAVLEYYAFEAKLSERETALNNYRLLARKSFREFIYSKVGFDPKTDMSVAWKQYHDRVVACGNVPDGYFSIFKEVEDIIVTLIRNNADVGVHFIPDIPIGQHWSKHWKKNNFEDRFGDRKQYNHYYPNYFNQSLSNPQPSYCYTDDTLPEFRKWVREDYLINKLPPYLAKKAKQGMIPESFVKVALLTFSKKKT